MTTETNVLPEVARLEKERKPLEELIDPSLLQSDEFLGSEEVKELLAIKEQIGLLGGKLNPVELVTIDNVSAQKAVFLERFGTDDESGVEFHYEKVKDRASSALRKGLEALGIENASELPFEELLQTASKQVDEILESIRGNRRKIRPERGVKSIPDMDKKEQDLFRSKLAANVALKGLAEELHSTLLLVKGISEHDDQQIAAAIAQMYGRTVSPELRSAADHYLREVPKKANDTFIGNGSSGLTESKFLALDETVKRQNMPSTAEGVARLASMRESKDPTALLFADSDEIKAAFQWTAEQLYQEYQERTGQPFPEDQKFSFVIGDYGSIDVRDKSTEGKQVCIPKNRIVDLKTLYQLIIHEIEAHVLQSYLSDVVVGLGGGMTKPNQEIVYEGLALTRENEGSRDFLGIENKLSENRAYYILAMDQALQGKGFWEVAHFIYEQARELLERRGVSAENIDKEAKEKAWTITYRVFRGHQKLDGFDASTAYAFTKDGAYLHGSLLVGQMNERQMGNIAGVAISHLGALSLLSRFDFSNDKMPITYQRHADRYFTEVLHPRLRKYVSSKKQSESSQDIP